MECALHSIFQMEGKKLASTMSKKRTRGANFVCTTHCVAKMRAGAKEDVVKKVKESEREMEKSLC